jgi:RND family efflux transporter MFP subunit
LPDARSSDVPVYLQLENESGFPHQGTIDYVSNQFNSSTGTLAVRGLFSNADGILIPGGFARIRVAATPLHWALLVTDRAIGTDQGQKYVLVAGPDNIVSVKPVVLGPAVDGLRVVRSGLNGDVNVIINGVINARPGSKVSPQPGEMYQFQTNQLQLQTTHKTEPVGETKQKAPQSSHAEGQGSGTEQSKSGGGR